MSRQFVCICGYGNIIVNNFCDNLPYFVIYFVAIYNLERKRKASLSGFEYSFKLQVPRLCICLPDFTDLAILH